MKYWLIEYEGIADVIEAETQDEADEETYQRWLDYVQGQSDYVAKPLTSELCADHGFDPEEYGLPPIEDGD